MRRWSIRFGPALIGLLLIGLFLRVGYVLAQAATDPAFARPALDGAYYLDWARALAVGEGAPSGAFYLAPLYPYVLWIFLELFGEDFALLYYAQQVSAVVAAGLLGLTARRLVGEVAGLSAAALALLYHPLLFFASRPVGESLAILLLSLSLSLFARSTAASGLTSGLVAGVAALARPNLLLVPVLWTLGELRGRRWTRAGLLIAGLALAMFPVLVRNRVASGHWVPVSSNAGITLYHGNGPGARGAGLLPPGFSGEVSSQREEATRLARHRSGRDLDPVEADRWWGRQALRARLEDPGGSLGLVLRRAALGASNAELTLAYAPGIDGNPLRWAAPIPFCVLLGLAAAGVALWGFSGSGGWTVWGAVAACAAVPIAFYVTSRYRLPLAAMLCLPAGSGLAGMLRPPAGLSAGRRWGACAIFAGVALVSLGVPAGDPGRTGKAVALAQRSAAWQQLGNLVEAESELRAALKLDPDSAPVLYNLGVLLERSGRELEAQESYRRALAARPDHAPAAANLGRLLHLGGRPREAVPILTRALRHNPYDEVCWTTLVVALAVAGELSQAEAAVEEASSLGVGLDPEMLELLSTLREDRPDPSTIGDRAPQEQEHE